MSIRVKLAKAGAALLLAAAAFIALCWLSYRHEMAIDPRRGIEESGYVTLGGLPQYIQIRGRDRRNPVLLLLNGGPGFTMLPETYTFREWEKDYTLVMWDQRGEGNTYYHSGAQAQGAMSIDRLARDGTELADYLRRHLGKDKIVVLGHSWGTMLGVHMVHLRPGLFHVYVGAGQLVDQQRGVAASLPPLLERAHRLGNERAETELRAAGPPPYSADLRQWISFLIWAQELDPPAAEQPPNGPAAWWNRANLYVARLFGPPELAPTITPAVQFSMNSLWPDIVTDDVAKLGRFEVPVVMVQGTEDLSTATSVAKKYYDGLEAPSKIYVPLEGRGHLAFYREPKTFLKILNRYVRPLAMEPPKS